MTSVKRFCLVLISFLWPISNVTADISILESKLTIPTYGIGDPDPNPRFYTGRTYQGAQGRIYPYPMSDLLTNERTDKEYTAVYLENDYIKICVLPEIGGRIFEALDKTNGYNFFYKQSVIKPSLIGMLGAWMSGGIEWNFPHHHRANTFMPMDYKLEKNSDGSVTLWLTEIEQRHRMKMLIGLTIWPDRNVLQAELKFFNRTPFVHSFLYFANPAVHVDSTYQVIFPPEVEFVTQHAKREFAQWPVAETRYGGFDYDKINISWWKNLPKPVSFFAWDHTSDYFAGYDHGKDAGVAYVANVHLAPGKKFFTFGCGDQGRMWDKMLTDSDGPYLELMAGAYSDNQPDYSWIQPYETKVVQQLWFPIRDLGGMSYANANGALNFTVKKQKAQLYVMTTGVHKKAAISLAYGDEIFWHKNVDMAPDASFHTGIALPKDAKETDIVISIKTENGRELLTFQPKAKAGEQMPQPVEPPKQPEKCQTNEELYLTGLRLEEFHNPQIDPYPFYEKALERDSNDVRVNIQMGILFCKRGMWQKAKDHLSRAINRLTFNYTRPKNGEAHYYLGLVFRAQGKMEQAYDSFYRAAWNFAWRAAAFYALAELDCLNKDFEKAREHINESLVVNMQNVKALNLKTTILRQLGDIKNARHINDHVLLIDPLDYWALNERKKITKISPAEYTEIKDTHTDLAFDRVQLYLELATDYANAGFYEDALQVLKQCPDSSNPLLSYYLAYYSYLQGDEAVAAYFLVHASTMSHEYCFPFRQETVPVLRYAVELQPQDANAYYYLGNLYYDHQPERAIQLWHKAVSLDPEFSIAFRNLGFGYAHFKNDIQMSIDYYEKAISLDKKDPRLFYELDVLYEAANTDPEKRLDLLMKNKKTVRKRDDAYARLTELYVLTGHYDEAIDILTTHHFNVWEGGGDIHNVFVDAHLLRGLNYLHSGNYEKARADFETATCYPDNLEVGRPIRDVNAPRNHYFIGLIRKLLRNSDAKEYFELASQSVARGHILFYKANALVELDQKTSAYALFDQMIKEGRTQKSRDDIDFFAKFGERGSRDTRRARAHLIAGLGYYGKGDTDLAKIELQKAQELDSSNVWVNYYLNLLEPKNK